MGFFANDKQQWIVIGYALIIFFLVAFLPDGQAKTIIGVVGFGLFIVGWPVLITIMNRKKKVAPPAPVLKSAGGGKGTPLVVSEGNIIARLFKSWDWLTDMAVLLIAGVAVIALLRVAALAVLWTMAFAWIGHGVLNLANLLKKK
jgi:hypothetical protein